METRKDNLYTEKYDRDQVVGTIKINSHFVVPEPRNIFHTESIPQSIEQEYRKFLNKVKDNNG